MITDIHRLVELLPGAAISITSGAGGRKVVARFYDSLLCQVPYDEDSTPEDVAAALKAAHAAKTAKRVVT